MITQTELKELLDYNPETGIFNWKVNRRGGAKAGDIAGTFHYDGYIKITINRKTYAGHRLAWLYVYGSFPDLKIDHINGNPSNNKICNLRLATDIENARNRKNKSTNTSGFKGVSKHLSVWRARCTSYGKTYNLGLYETKELASAAYEQKAEELHGKFYFKHCRS